MDRFKLNNYNIYGLATYSIGAIVDNSIGAILMIFGLLIFLTSVKLNFGFYISYVILLIGTLIKIMHWPYGNDILLVGLISILISGYFRFIHKNFSFDRILIFSSVVILTSGKYLKMEHIPLAKEFILIGYASISISYFFRFIRKKDKCFEDYNKMVLVFFFSISSIFKTFHWPYATLLSYIFILTLWTWILWSLNREHNWITLNQK